MQLYNVIKQPIIEIFKEEFSADIKEAIKGVEAFLSVPGRFEAVDTKEPLIICFWKSLEEYFFDIIVPMEEQIEIKDGKIDRPVTLFVVSSNFYELLNNIEEIACDLEENFIDVAAPSVKIKSVMISGK